MRTVLLVGASGQLGTDLQRSAPDAVNLVAVTHGEPDVLDLEQAKKVIAEVRPDVVVNAAAYVDVEGCETDRERAFAVNAYGVRNLVEAGARIVQISTDYVFDGSARRPYV